MPQNKAIIAAQPASGVLEKCPVRRAVSKRGTWERSGEMEEGQNGGGNALKKTPEDWRTPVPGMWRKFDKNLGWLKNFLVF